MNIVEEYEGMHIEDKQLNKTCCNDKNSLKVLGIMSVATIIAILFKNIGLNESNIILVFIVGVLFSARSTEGYIYGVLASIIGVLSFNFFFTEPYFSFRAYRSDYPITFLIMLLTSVITSTLTSKIKREVRISYIKERRLRLLYINNKKLLKARNKNQIMDFCGESLVEICSRNVIITIVDDKNKLIEPKIYISTNKERENTFQYSLEKNALRAAFNLGEAVGIGTEFYNKSRGYYYPIKGHKAILGVIGMSCFEKEVLTGNEKVILESISAQVALAIEREDLFEKSKQANLAVESERLRGNLLRSISHDLRTPLTSIMGSASTIIENYDLLDKELQKELLQNICEDTSWLIHSVENILSMTRIDEGTLKIKKNLEVVEEIVVEAISRVRRFSDNHDIKIDLPKDMILLSVDGLLIEQVLVNIIHNAIKYTADDSNIEVNVKVEDNNVIFQVEDDGKGIPEEEIPYIFTRFYTKSNSNQLENRGIGLGLAICESIVIAHNGRIEVFNNKQGGATFRVIIPKEGGEIDGDKTISTSS
ncbi:DUF4118 domain-containing protein [Clostridium sp.]|uniref:DUF4118 domain-containing protein n=1 Tax=Clostridium sp. TaxID=1506 RepID=UPI003216EF52